MNAVQGISHICVKFATALVLVYTYATIHRKDKKTSNLSCYTIEFWAYRSGTGVGTRHLNIHLRHHDVVLAAAQQVVQARQLQPAGAHRIAAPRKPPRRLVAGQHPVSLQSHITA